MTCELGSVNVSICQMGRVVRLLVAVFPLGRPPDQAGRRRTKRQRTGIL